MRPWQFGKPKTPGFGISRDYYLSVLCSRAVLPSIFEIANPEGMGGAVVGLGAPLGGGNGGDRTALQKPLERGAYVVASKDRKTVIQILVVSKEEAGFDPEVFAQSQYAAGMSPELIARLKGTWNLAQLKFESHDPMVYSSLDMFLALAKRVAELSEGVVGDALCRRYMLPGDVIHPHRLDPRIDARDHVVVQFRARPDGIHAYTLGMHKFSLHEYEIHNLFEEDQVAAQTFLLALAQRVLIGDVTKEGDRFGSLKLPFEARVGGFDRSMWEGTPVFELLPPTAHTPGEVMRAWSDEAGLR